MGESHYSACFNLKPSLGFNGYNTYMSGLGKWIENILPVLLSHRGPPLSLGASISSGLRWQWEGWGGDGLSSFEKSYKFFHTLKALAVLTLPYEKKGAGGGERG